MKKHQEMECEMFRYTIFMEDNISKRSMQLVIEGTSWQIVKKDKFENLRNTSLAAPGALAHLLQRRNACKIQNVRQGAPKWPTLSGKGFNAELLGIPNNFR